MPRSPVCALFTRALFTRALFTRALFTRALFTRALFTRALFVAASIAAAWAASAPGEALADSGGPPTYGRIEGDLAFVVGAGAVVGARGVRPEAELRVRYLDSAGAFVTYEDGAIVGSGAEPRRCIATGVELRPLFFYRWLRGQESGNPRFDLWVDSWGLEVGAAWWQPQGEGFAARSGLQVSLGTEIPITGTATGPWVALRGGLRWSEDALASSGVRSADDRSAFVSLTVAWHQLATVHAVDVGDEAPE